MSTAPENAPLVVVVDDERSMSRVILWVLDDLGFRTAHYETAEAAIDFLRDRKADVVLSDVRLPGMGGVDLAAWAKQRPGLGATAVVLMSAYREPDGHAADGFISKPFDIEELGATLRSLMKDLLPADTPL